MRASAKAQASEPGWVLALALERVMARELVSASAAVLETVQATAPERSPVLAPGQVSALVLVSVSAMEPVQEPGSPSEPGSGSELAPGSALANLALE